MVLCPKCNKKLDSSYREWSAKNPGRSFRDYLSDYCISELAIAGVGEQQRITRRVGLLKNFRWLALSLVVALVTVVAVVWGFILYKDSQKGASINAILTDNWQLRYYGDLGVTLKFPFELNQPRQLADSVQIEDSTQVITSFTTRKWKRAGVALVTASRIEYKPDFGVNRELATSQILPMLIAENAMQGFETTPSDYSMGKGLKARMFTGSYLIKSEAYSFRALMVIRGDTVWYFMINYLRAMPEGSLLAEKFFRTILL
ncbi:hypothetical protein BN938_1331 [Mucinivorans hirudinis]|uniref:Uncharacterized protein n=1 Tax=Mucinivorans hirudinis TaxID=1433126 RepID=A0A060RD17_9BACT|nr:hypothetical protein BN938_1331 [Mucinivorans hirudinis]